MNKVLIQFTAIREDFSTFECENGQILRVKSVIVIIVENQDGEKKSSAIDFKDVSGVFTPNSIDTSNLEMAKPEDVTAENEVRELDFKMTKQVLNIYETDHSLIVLLPEVEKISITDKKDKNGDPILRYTMKNSISVIDKKTFSEGPPSSKPSLS